MATQSSLLPNLEQNKIGSLYRASPALWDYNRFASNHLSDSEHESRTKRLEFLREQTNDMLLDSAKDAIENIKLINLLCRLGVSYYFEGEIEDQLNHRFDALPQILDDKDYDLYTISILFIVLRQHGYKMSCDVFKKFKGEDGTFKKAITSNDIRSVLGLYEASFFSVHEEDILDEALAITKSHLESLAMESISPHLAQYIRNALILPFHKGLPRVEARQYIEFYEKDESPNPILLEFVKLDYNRVQLLYKQEVGELARWWNNTQLKEKLFYARDRILECYFWAFGMQFKPQYSLSRIMTTKYTKMVSLADDTYDTYAAVDESRAFTEAFKRCNMDATKQLPDYMKYLYKALMDLLDETKNINKEGRSYHYVKQGFNELLRCYGLEAQWCSDGYVPTFCEYMLNGYATSSYGVLAMASFIGMQDVIGIKDYEWILTDPKIVKATKLIGRLLNDLVSREDELEKGDCATGVECYMKDYNVSKERAVDEIQKICANAWKDINEECMRPTTLPRTILEIYVNTARTTEVAYKHTDGYTHSLSLKYEINSCFIDPIPL